PQEISTSALSAGPVSASLAFAAPPQAATRGQTRARRGANQAASSEATTSKEASGAEKGCSPTQIEAKSRSPANAGGDSASTSSDDHKEDSSSSSSSSSSSQAPSSREASPVASAKQHVDAVPSKKSSTSREQEQEAKPHPAPVVHVVQEDAQLADEEAEFVTALNKYDPASSTGITDALKTAMAARHQRGFTMMLRDRDFTRSRILLSKIFRVVEEHSNNLQHEKKTRLKDSINVDAMNYLRLSRVLEFFFIVAGGDETSTPAASWQHPQKDLPCDQHKRRQAVDTSVMILHLSKLLPNPSHTADLVLFVLDFYLSIGEHAVARAVYQSSVGSPGSVSKDPSTSDSVFGDSSDLLRTRVRRQLTRNVANNFDYRCANCDACLSVLQLIENTTCGKCGCSIVLDVQKLEWVFVVASQGSSSAGITRGRSIADDASFTSPRKDAHAAHAALNTTLGSFIGPAGSGATRIPQGHQSELSPASSIRRVASPMKKIIDQTRNRRFSSPDKKGVLAAASNIVPTSSSVEARASCTSSSSTTAASAASRGGRPKQVEVYNDLPHRTEELPSLVSCGNCTFPQFADSENVGRSMQYRRRTMLIPSLPKKCTVCGHAHEGVGVLLADEEQMPFKMVS
ncbi:unnamed protein product, partial [Amoebophrya sp. A25]